MYIMIYFAHRNVSGLAVPLFVAFLLLLLLSLLLGALTKNKMKREINQIADQLANFAWEKEEDATNK